MGKRHILAGAVAGVLMVAGCTRAVRVESGPAAADAGASAMSSSLLIDSISAQELQRRVAQFAPAAIDIDESSLQPWERQVLARLIRASDLIHQIYMVQVSPELPAWRAALERERGAARDAALAYFDLMVGPWDRLEHDRPFLDVGPKPKGAGFYPHDMTAAEIDAWVKAHPDQKDAITGYFTLLRRGDGGIVTVPYSEAYAPQLREASRLLREAADISQNATLSDFLRKRADAFLSNDYFASDMAWMDIAGSRIEPTIGPYEVYEDELMGYKASFESFIAVADPAAAAELDRLKSQMKTLEENLPIDDKYKNLNRGFESPIRVVDVVYTAGDARRGVQTIAYNLPNDERVREAKGSKKVMLRNVMHAKFDKILTPIAGEVLDADVASQVDFQPWFINVLMHELAHGVGPGNITVNGEETTVNRALRDKYSAIEEAKADVTGLHNITVLAKQGMYDDAFVRRAFLGHAADLFRSVRFGAGEAHGLATLMEFNYFVEKGAIRFDASTGKFEVDVDKLIDANRDLAHELLTLEALGSYEQASAMLAKYGTMSPQMERVLGRLAGKVPVDIRPVYGSAGRLVM